MGSYFYSSKRSGISTSTLTRFFRHKYLYIRLGITCEYFCHVCYVCLLPASAFPRAFSWYRGPLLSSCPPAGTEDPQADLHHHDTNITFVILILIHVTHQSSNLHCPPHSVLPDRPTEAAGRAGCPLDRWGATHELLQKSDHVTTEKLEFHSRISLPPKSNGLIRLKGKNKNSWTNSSTLGQTPSEWATHIPRNVAVERLHPCIGFLGFAYSSILFSNIYNWSAETRCNNHEWSKWLQRRIVLNTYLTNKCKTLKYLDDWKKNNS